MTTKIVGCIFLTLNREKKTNSLPTKEFLLYSCSGVTLVHWYIGSTLSLEVFFLQLYQWRTYLVSAFNPNFSMIL